jgi:hypothetical protein
MNPSLPLGLYRDSLLWCSNGASSSANALSAIDVSYIFTSSRTSRSRVTATPTTPAGHRNVRIRWTDKIEDAVLEASLRPFGKDIAQIALTKLTAGKSPSIVRLLLPSSLLLLSKLRASTITTRRIGSYRRSSAAFLAGVGRRQRRACCQ